MRAGSTRSSGTRRKGGSTTRRTERECWTKGEDSPSSGPATARSEQSRSASRPETAFLGLQVHRPGESH
eukprot:3719408-Heterocapsa_arctica.AAC.1